VAWAAGLSRWGYRTFDWGREARCQKRTPTRPGGSEFCCRRVEELAAKTSPHGPAGGAADQFSVLGEGSARSGPKSPPAIPRTACKMNIEKSHGLGVFLPWRGQLWRLDSRPGRGAACQQGLMGYQPRAFHAGWCSQHRQSARGSLGVNGNLDL